MKPLVEALRAEHQRARERGGDMMTYGEGQPLMVEAANEIERLRAALATAHEVFAAEIEGLHKIILMNQPDYKRTIVASVDGL